MNSCADILYVPLTDWENDMGFLAFFGSMMLGGIVGYAAERLGFTHNGYLPSIVIALGGVVLFFMVRVMFGISFGSHGLNAIISAAGALILIPTEAATRARSRSRTRNRRR